MAENRKKILAGVMSAYLFALPISYADVNSEGYWEAIGLGNFECSEFSIKIKDEGYKELAAVWLSGFMSGVNFTSQEVYDITWGEDVYVLTDLLIKRCGESPEKYLSDIAAHMVLNRYQNKNYTSTKDVKNP